MGGPGVTFKLLKSEIIFLQLGSFLEPKNCVYQGFAAAPFEGNFNHCTSVQLCEENKMS